MKQKKKNGLTPGASYLALGIIASQFRIWLFCEEFFIHPAHSHAFVTLSAPLVQSDSRAVFDYTTCFPVCLLNLLRWRIRLPRYPSTSARCMREHVQAPTCVCVCAARMCACLLVCVHVFISTSLMCACRSKDVNVKNGQWEQRVDSMTRQA